MAKKPDPNAADIDLDKIEGKFRAVSSVATIYSGYIDVFIIASALAVVLSIPIGAGAYFFLDRSGMDDPLGIAVLFFGGFLAGGALYYWLFYWMLAEILRLNRVLAAATIAFVLLAVAGVLAGFGLAAASLYAAFAGGALPDELRSVSDPLVRAVYFCSVAFLWALAGIVNLSMLRGAWAYVASSFSSRVRRRILKHVDHTEARLLGGQGVILGGGISIPTLKKGATHIRVLNVMRCVLASAALLVLILGVSNLPRFINPAFGLFMPVVAVFSAAFLAGVAALFAYWGRLCLRGARKRARFGLDAVRSQDERPPTLFLRPFRDDQVELLRNRGKTSPFSVEQKTRELDHVLVEEFSWSGPIVAIGRPGERELPFGAARTFLSNDEWQKEALALAAAAGEIVMVVDDTPGVQWEISQVCGPSFRQKTLFLFHPRFSDSDANRAVVTRIVEGLGVEAPGDGKPVLGLWLHEDGAVRVLRSTRFSVEAFTMALRDFFRTRAQLEAARVKLAKRAARQQGSGAPVAATA